MTSRRLVGAALLALAVSVSGCTAADQASPTPAPTTVESGRFTQPEHLGSALGAAARAAGTARGTVDAAGEQGSVRGEVAYEFADEVRLSARVTVTGPIATDLAVVMDGTDPGDAVYLEVPALFRLFVAQPWVRVVQGDGSDSAGLADDLADALVAEVPGDWLADLQAGTELSYGGTDVLDGVEVEKYEAGGTLNGESVRRTYWVDEDNLVRRLDTATTSSGISTHTYRGWGEPVVISVPDASVVTDLPPGLFPSGSA